MVIFFHILYGMNFKTIHDKTKGYAYLSIFAGFCNILFILYFNFQLCWERNSKNIVLGGNFDAILPFRRISKTAPKSNRSDIVIIGKTMC